MRHSTRMTGILALSLLSLPAATGTAQTSLGNAQMIAVEGTCDALRIGKRDMSTACGTKLLNIVYPNGRLGFYFVLGDGTLVGFTGIDGENPTPDDDLLQVDQIIATRKDTPDKPDVSRAKGTCRYGNPYKGVMTLSSSGTLAKGGAFAAIFTTNGKPPA